MDIVAASTRCAEASLTLSDLQFPLPTDLIAQVPAERRDQARLLVLDRHTGDTTHTEVCHLPDRLRPGDLLVVNDTRVIPARIFGKVAPGGAVELLLIRPEGQGDGDHVGARPALRDAATKTAAPQGERFDHLLPCTHSAHPEEAPSLGAVSKGAGWLCLGKPARRLKLGATLSFPDGMSATVTAVHGDGRYSVTFDDAARLPALLAEHGEIPLPPYIRRPDGPLPLDQTRYQTIFAAAPGAIAAPTAGLHFSDELVHALTIRGIELARLTLHVGPGTFLPIRTDSVDAHVMEPEWCNIPFDTVEAIRRVKAAGGRIVAVGTTTTRALESAASDDDVVLAGARWAERFIVPGYQFRVVDALFTNFHLPGSTLLLLVSALAGPQRILAAYAEAIRQRYRFYSYGDAMLIQ